MDHRRKISGDVGPVAERDLMIFEAQDRIMARPGMWVNFPTKWCPNVELDTISDCDYPKCD